MKLLQLFLDAVKERLGTRGVYVFNRISTACKFPAYEKITIEVWHIDGSYMTRISCIEKTGRVDEEETLELNLIKETMKEVLKYYGI